MPWARKIEVRDGLQSFWHLEDTYCGFQGGVVMALRRSAFLTVFAASGLLQPALCQVGSGGGGGFVTGSIVGSAGFTIPGLKGMPYSAEFVIKRVQTLADGTHITQEQKQFQARDSEGRTRTEIYLPDMAGGNADQPTMVTIQDPTSGQFIHLNAQQKTATVQTFGQHTPTQAGSVRQVSPPPSVQTVHPRSNSQPSIEKLGGQTIDGVYAEGTRITHVIPAGTMGNDRDISMVTETWRSPDLKIDVRSTTTDPRSGERTTEIKSLSRAEPDPALFQVPSDYKVQTPQVPNQ
jgi:hypothetical protein